MRILLFIFCASLIVDSLAQDSHKSCSHEAIAKRHIEDGDDFLRTMAENELFIQDFLKNELPALKSKPQKAKYTIPVVLHVFHDGDDGKLTMDQIESGLQVLNDDINGLNSDWNNIDAAFNQIKGKLDIEFCLASIDPFGNATTGVNYYQDPEGMLNEGELRDHAWDNFKYFNIYLPKYVHGGPSVFTAYAYYPSFTLATQNLGGVFYSSIRWGYGPHSELDDGQEWASVVTHEVGHWLNLLHTFRGGCADNDQVDDTPPTLGGDIFLEDCYNNDNSCGVRTNGSNYMDYNHDCKRMFTQGQVDRMTAALHLGARSNLWSEANLIETGCMDVQADSREVEFINVNLYPNPSSGIFNVESNYLINQLQIFNFTGERVYFHQPDATTFDFDLSQFSDGLYYYHLVSNHKIKRGLIIKAQ